MEKDPSRFEYSGYNETRSDKQIDQAKSSNITGSILFSQKTFKKKAFRWIRIRSFFTKQKKFKRLVEFSVHPNGVHMLRLAVFYSESGCKMCKIYVEKNLF